MFDINIREKLVKVNFIAIFIEGTIDRAVKEQEVDPETHKLNLSYFEVIDMDRFYQNSTGMLAAIKGCFTKHNLSEFEID